MGYKYFETVTSFPAQTLKLTEITLRKSSISFFPLSFVLTYLTGALSKKPLLKLFVTYRDLLLLQTDMET